MPWYEYACEICLHEWEDLMSLSDPLPEECPECQERNCIKKLISLPALGKVELYGQELKAKLKNDAQKEIQLASKSENELASLVGETRYEQNLAVQKTISENRPKIKTKKSQT